MGATRFFSDSPFALAAASSNNRELAGFPTWTATFVGSKHGGVQDVYDISVPVTESFLAMGVTVHNCPPELLARTPYRGEEADVWYVSLFFLHRSTGFTYVF